MLHVRVDQDVKVAQQGGGKLEATASCALPEYAQSGPDL